MQYIISKDAIISKWYALTQFELADKIKKRHYCSLSSSFRLILPDSPQMDVLVRTKQQYRRIMFCTIYFSNFPLKKLQQNANTNTQIDTNASNTNTKCIDHSDYHHLSLSQPP